MSGSGCRACKIQKCFAIGMKRPPKVKKKTGSSGSDCQGLEISSSSFTKGVRCLVNCICFQVGKWCQSSWTYMDLSTWHYRHVYILRGNKCLFVDPSRWAQCRIRNRSRIEWLFPWVYFNNVGQGFHLTLDSTSWIFVTTYVTLSSISRMFSVLRVISGCTVIH